MKNLAHLAGAAVLAAHLRRHHVRHVHVHFAFGAAEVAIFLQALTGIPYSMTIHGSDVLLPHPLTEEKLNRAAFIVSNCRFHIDRLRHHFPSLSDQKFHLVRLGIDLNAGRWSRATPLTHRCRLHILNVARLETVKAQEVLIRACAVLKRRKVPFLCRIAGDGPLKDRLRALISQLGLADHIRMLGRVYQEEVSRLYDTSNVVVLSSKSEGTPMTIIEAMAKSRPVIAPDITALPEMIVDGQTGFLFKSGSHEDLADKLGLLADDPERLIRMGQLGRKRAEKLFDLERNARRLVDIFRMEIQ